MGINRPKQKTSLTKNIKNYINNSESFEKKEIASYSWNNPTKHQTQASDNDENQPAHILFQTEKNQLIKKGLLIKCNLDRKSGLNLSTPILQLAHYLKIDQAKTPILKQDPSKKTNFQVNYKFGKQNGKVSTARINHKLEGLAFWNIRERISVGVGMGLQRSRWSIPVGKKLTTKAVNQNFSSPGIIVFEKENLFINNDTIFINYKINRTSQETNESSY